LCWEPGTGTYLRGYHYTGIPEGDLCRKYIYKASGTRLSHQLGELSPITSGAGVPRAHTRVSSPYQSLPPPQLWAPTSIIYQVSLNMQLGKFLRQPTAGSFNTLGSRLAHCFEYRGVSPKQFAMPSITFFAVGRVADVLTGCFRGCPTTPSEVLLHIRNPRFGRRTSFSYIMEMAGVKEARSEIAFAICSSSTL